MPAGTDGLRDRRPRLRRGDVRDRFDYLFVLHTDVGHPHLHLTVKALEGRGERLNPKKAELEAWRQGSAQALRDHGVETEATRPRAR
jgi:type IV secretory pathway VirD2 relaxase